MMIVFSLDWYFSLSFLTPANMDVLFFIAAKHDKKYKSKDKNKTYDIKKNKRRKNKGREDRGRGVPAVNAVPPPALRDTIVCFSLGT